MNEFSIAQKIAIYALPVLFAIVVHEVAHGWVAEKFGDSTARLSGRLTLNPLPHIDLVGTIILPILCLVAGGFIFGWAKPVPVDARNMQNPRRDMAIVAAAGPVSNLIMAVLWALVARFSGQMNEWFGMPLALMGQVGMTVNVMLAVLNLLPLPPLDGGRVLVSALPPQLGSRLEQIEPYGFVILIVLMATNILGIVLFPLIYILLAGIAGLVGLN